MIDSLASPYGESTSKADGKWHGNSIYIGLVTRTCERTMTFVLLHVGFHILLNIPGQSTPGPLLFKKSHVDCVFGGFFSIRKESWGFPKNQSGPYLVASLNRGTLI